jgi:nucleoside phosphorylase
MGTISATAVAGSLRVSFPNITLALVIGICGVIPSGTDQEIVLGDVIISQALILYDLGRQYPGGFKRKTDVRDTLGRPSLEIRAIQAKLGTSRYRQKMQNNITIFLAEYGRSCPKRSFQAKRMISSTAHHMCTSTTRQQRATIVGKTTRYASWPSKRNAKTWGVSLSSG